MKKFFLVTFLFITIFLSGCYGENVAPTSDKTENAASATDEINESPATTSNSENEDSEDVSSSQDLHNGELEEDTNISKPSSKRHFPTKEKISNTSNGEVPDKNKNDTPVETIPKDKPSDKIFNFDGENFPLMAGIAAIIVLLVLILVLLIYDRHKMKKTLNNLNNNVSPQNTNPVSNNPTPAFSTSTIQTSGKPLTFRVGNLQNIGSRNEQQDSFCVSNIRDEQALKEKGLLAVVADGMGGLEGGANISRIVAETFLNQYNNQVIFDPAAFLYDTAEKSEMAVDQYIENTGINGGSTVVAVIVKNSQMNYVSVGDSHIYLLRDNNLKLINREHNFAAVLKEKADRGEIDKSEPYVNPKRNALTAYIGIGNFRTVDKNNYPIPLKNGDKILLCSDGVYNALGDEALIQALEGTAIAAANKLENAILAQNIPMQDNFTAIILECIES